MIPQMIYHHDFVRLGQLETRMFGGSYDADFGNGPQGIFRVGSQGSEGRSSNDGARFDRTGHDWFNDTVDGLGYGCGNHANIASETTKRGLFVAGVGISNTGSANDGACTDLHSANVGEEPYLLCGSGGTVGPTAPTSYGGFSSDFGIAQPEPLDGASPQ